MKVKKLIPSLVKSKVDFQAHESPTLIPILRLFIHFRIILPLLRDLFPSNVTNKNVVCTFYIVHVCYIASNLFLYSTTALCNVCWSVQIMKLPCLFHLNDKLFSSAFSSVELNPYFPLNVEEPNSESQKNHIKTITASYIFIFTILDTRCEHIKFLIEW
jgi:hypothetical protein